MAIGPEARRQLQGRVVVSAVLYALVGMISTVLGMGPIVVGAGAIETTLGLTGVANGVVLLLSARGLVVQRASRRRWATVGGLAMALSGAAVAGWALVSLSACRPSSPACAPATITTALVGVTMVVLGLASAAMIRRLRRSALDQSR